MVTRMSSTAGINDHQRAFKDAETLRKEEWKRRRLLRLEQVRQQSKDIANLVRQKVQNEREKQLGLVEVRVNAKTQQWQVRKLKALQNEYESTLHSVGKGHAEAACQPDEEDLRRKESDKILAAAQKRGQDALNRLREEEAARRKADEERRSQLLQVRAIEEARSAAVVALPLPESTAGIRSILPKKSVCVVAPPPKPCKGSTSDNSNKTTTLPIWSKKSWPQASLPLGVIQHEQDQGDAFGIHNDQTNAEVSPTNQLINVSSHGDVLKTTMQLQSASPTKTSQPSSVREVGASAMTSEIQFYDYTSCYQSRSDKVSGIVEKVQMEEEINAKDAADMELSNEISQYKLEASYIHREQQRSREALRRVQVQRDYKNFIGDLSSLAKQNALFQSCTNNTAKSFARNKTQEEQLKLAVENIIQDDGETNISDLDSSNANTSDGSLVVSRLGETPGSIPRLNVGRYQAPVVAAEEVSPKVDASPAESIILAPPTYTPHVILGARQESNERDAALRNLVQRINVERQSLIHSNQPCLNLSQRLKPTQEHGEENETEVDSLEKKVLLQRRQLEAQRSEVKQLDASIVLPDYVSRSHGELEETSPKSSSVTHESIVIEPSHSEESQDLSPSLLIRNLEKSNESKVNRGKSKKMNKDVNKSVSKPIKENMMYSMDVSLSSVYMDQTENSSSGSKSVSLHGVQVLVKVCGAEEDSSESRSLSLSNNYDKAPKVIELSSSSDNSDSIKEDRKKLVKKHSRAKMCSDRKLSEKDKSNIKHSSDSTNGTRKKQEKETIPQKTTEDKKVHRSSGHKKNEETRKPVDQSRNVIDNAKTNQKDSAEPKRKQPQVKQRKVASEKEIQEQPASTSTSYLSPPDRVLSSLTQDIKKLIALARGNVQHPQGLSDAQQNASLVRYINRLLAMSRESIDGLNVSCSEVTTPSSSLFHSVSSVNEVDANMTDIGFNAAAQDHMTQSAQSSQNETTTNDIHQSIDDDSQNLQNVYQRDYDWLFNPVPNDPSALSEMTKQCHEKISALNKMIEEVRRQAVVNSPTSRLSEHSSYDPNQSRSPLPLDSTAYMSPPPQVLEWADIMPHNGDTNEERMSLDPYSAAIRQLLAEVRSELVSKSAKPLEEPRTSFFESPPLIELKQVERPEPGHLRPRPPVAFWRNIEKCNVSTPMEPHELSTIPELGTTLHDSSASQLSAPGSPTRSPHQQSTPGTPPDVIAELLRRKLLTSPFAWAKQKEIKSGSAEKPSLSYDSNVSPGNSQESDLSSGKSGTGQSDVSASKETNTLSLQSQNSSSNGSKGWKTNLLTSPANTSADEVEGDFRRMGIGWVGAMLRKTKEAGALSSTSSSESSPFKVDNNEFKNLSAITDDEPILSSSLIVAVTQGQRGHSTPVKHPSETSSSSGSYLV